MILLDQSEPTGSQGSSRYLDRAERTDLNTLPASDTHFYRQKHGRLRRILLFQEAVRTRLGGCTRTVTVGLRAF